MHIAMLDPVGAFPNHVISNFEDFLMNGATITKAGEMVWQPYLESRRFQQKNKTILG